MSLTTHLTILFLALSTLNIKAFTLNFKSIRGAFPHRQLGSQSSSATSASSAADSIDRQDHVRILSDNLFKHTGKDLLLMMDLDGNTDSPGWQDEIHMSMRWALLSHGADNDLDGPVNNYANFGACSAFSYAQSQILNLPACRMAVPGWDQEALTQLYSRLRENNPNNVIQHEGFRCTSDQRRFYIRDALVRIDIIFLMIYFRNPRRSRR